MSSYRLERPKYQPGECKPGWLHLGVGNFHRAHQALFADRLLHFDAGRDWGIIGVNLLPSGENQLAQMQERGNRYVLNTNAADGSREFREIGSLLDLVDNASEPERAQQMLAEPSIQLVTLTVTGAGYHALQDGGLDLASSAVAAEFSGGAPSTIYGFLRAGLSLRKDAGAGAVTILSCDNMRGNGTILKSTFLEYLEAANENGLLGWMADNVTFPSSMVDRITPVPPARLSQEVHELFGIEDDASVMAEDFVQWVIEDDFANSRPPLEEVGVQIVPSVHPYEEAKIRVLNGGHAAVGQLAALRGFTYVWEAVNDPELSQFYDEFQLQEVIPAFPGESLVDLDDYQKQVKSRFGNRALADRLARICRRGTTKIPEFIVPTIEGNFAQRRVPSRSLAVVASWFDLMRRCVAGAGPFDYDDANWEKLKPCLNIDGAHKFATNKWLWGELPSRHPQFVAELVRQIEQLKHK